MMRAQSVDPRDQTHEFDEPEFRVFFWSEPPVTGPGAAWLSDEWELSGADIDEVIDWVHTHNNGRRASLWAVTRSGDDVTHTRLAGTDPTASDGTWPEWASDTWPTSK